MRKLTIKRTKSFVACLVKSKVYIEDTVCGDTVINGVYCRKIGSLKNGEEQTFEITEQSAKVFVIGDRLSKNFCNDFYQINEGTEDVVLSGGHKYNPINGNAFRFDNNGTAEVKANRRKGLLIGSITLIVAGIVGFAIGLGGALFSPDNTPKEFSSSGMTITLTGDFIDMSTDNGYTATYASGKVVVIALKETFADYDGLEEYTIDEYGELTLEVNGLPSGYLKEVNGITYFEYEARNSDADKLYVYRSYIYKTDDAFWVIQFVTEKKDYDGYTTQFDEWAGTVQFLQ